MSGFSELLSAAKAAPKPSIDVDVLLDAALAERRDELQAKLEQAQSVPSDDRLTGVSPQAAAIAEIEKQVNDLLVEAASSLVTLRFTRLPGDKWTDITARCPVRLNVAIDRRYGYNLQAACRLAAPLSGVRVDGDSLVPLTVTPATEDTPRVDEWEDLFSTISGYDLGQIHEAIYRLNEYDPAERINSLKKALATRPA